MVGRWYAFAILVAVAVASVSRPQERRSVPDTTRASPSEEAPLHFIGPSSCSARACHGGLEPIADPLDTHILQDEYPKWLLRDKHTHAYQVLLEEPSLRIARHLAGDAAVQPPHKDERCLACHTVPFRGQLQADLRLGVSCEACHGEASMWLPLHTRPDWRKLSAEQKRRQGMVPVSDISARAEACASCHVGSPGRDVNHDLIAAGHPRLNFEYSSYMANLPAHWNTANAKRQAEHALTDWAIGQVESARASLRLLEHRAKSKDAPWPEFAEYDCFACHHDLDAPSWRQSRKDEVRKPGTLPWGTWYFTMPSLLADSGAGFRTAFIELRKEMEKPLPARAVSVSKLQSELKGLEGRLGQVDSKKLKQLLAVPAADKSWDSAEQLFLAACVMPESQKSLMDLNRYRALRPDWSSPKLFAPEFFDAFQNVMKTP